MGKIELLDCTLRDGGYVNNWLFGKDTIKNILHILYESNVDIIEAGFIRDVEYDEKKSVFSSIKQLDTIINNLEIQKNNTQLAVMAEIAHPIPLSKIESASETGIDIIRVIVWKTKHTPDGRVVDALNESLEYCKRIAEKGYKVCIQPNRTDQYSDIEFIHMLNMFQKINPYAIYVVDSWGTMYSKQVLHYMKLADGLLVDNIKLGFHGHNNMMQAFSTAEKIAEEEFMHDIILDASIDGIGRGAGNLNLELIARFLNHEKGCNYNIDKLFEIYDLYIKNLSRQYHWGSSLPFMLSADKNVNPNYAADYENKLTLREMKNAYEEMTADDSILYTAELSQKYLKKIKG